MKLDTLESIKLCNFGNCKTRKLRLRALYAARNVGDFVHWHFFARTMCDRNKLMNTLMQACKNTYMAI